MPRLRVGRAPNRRRVARGKDRAGSGSPSVPYKSGRWRTRVAKAGVEALPELAVQSGSLCPRATDLTRVTQVQWNVLQAKPPTQISAHATLVIRAIVQPRPLPPINRVAGLTLADDRVELHLGQHQAGDALVQEPRGEAIHIAHASATPPNRPPPPAALALLARPFAAGVRRRVFPCVEFI